MSGEDAPRPYLENLIVLEIKTNKQTKQKTGDISRCGIGRSAWAKTIEATSPRIVTHENFLRLMDLWKGTL
jgi:hypothetical protein